MNDESIAIVTEDSDSVVDYVENGIPAIIRNGCQDWPALLRWTPEHFCEMYGTLPIRYRVSPSGIHPNLQSEQDRPQETIRTTLGTFVNMLREESTDKSSGKYYLTGDVKTFTVTKARTVREGAHSLLEDILIPKIIPQDDIAHIGFWLSPPSARTWLHYETGGNQMFFAQVRGTASITMFSPDQLSMIYPFPVSRAKAVNFSRVNIATPDYDRFPRFSEAKRLQGTLRAGDILFIPSFWFHSIQSCDEFNLNVSVSWPCRHAILSLTALRSAVLFQMMQILRRITPNTSGLVNSDGIMIDDANATLSLLTAAISTFERMHYF